MIRFFKKIWNYISFIGIDNIFPHPDTKRIILSNRLGVVSFLFSFPFIFLYSLNGFYYLAWIILGFTFSFLLAPFLNYFKHYQLSKLLLYSFIIFDIFFVASSFGRDPEIHFMYMVLIVFPLIVFKLEQIGYISLCFIITILSLATLYYTNFSLFAIEQEVSLEFLNTLSITYKFTSAMIVPVIFFSMLSVTDKTEKILDESNVFLQNQLQAVFDNSQDAIFLVDNSKRVIIKANRKTIELFETANEKDLFAVFDTHLCQQLHTDDEITHALETKGKWAGELLCETQKGNKFWGNISIQIIEIGKRNYHSIRITDITENKITEENIKNSLREKEVLLSEIHHRVKNNMAVISGMLTIQGNYLEDAKAKGVLEEVKGRIYAMALIHETLYQNSSFAKIEYASYISDMARNIRSSFNSLKPKVNILLKCELIYLDIKTAIPCGLLLNELLTNAFKHAFLGIPSGEITIELYRKANLIYLVVSDNGSGFNLLQASQKSSGMGITLVKDLVKQINGKLEIDTTKGSSFTISFS